MKLNSINTPYNASLSTAVANKARHVSFAGGPVRAPFYPETLDTIGSVYKDYKKSLGETSLSDIKTISLNLSKELQVPKKEVLEAMQLVTQFANMKSLKLISESISKQKIEYLGDDSMNLQRVAYDIGLSKENRPKFFADTGIHRSLVYIFDKKGLAPISYRRSNRIGVILDEEKINQLEQIKKSEPENFEKISKSKDLKFFYISGWETGIPVVDRTKSLEEKTRELLLKSKKENKPVKKVIDSSYMDRIKSLGITPVVIKNENLATEMSIYNQMRPEQMCRAQMQNIIEANSIVRTSELTNASLDEMAKYNDAAAKNLKDTLCVYTPEKMSMDLKKIYDDIENYAKENNKQTLYVIPNKTAKSTDYIYYSYKKINKIDSSKFMPISAINDSNRMSYDGSQLYPDARVIDPKKTLLVFLDDCSISGDSIRKIRTYDIAAAGVSKQYSLLFTSLKGTDNAVEEFHSRKFKNPAELIFLEKIALQDVKKNKKLVKQIGHPTFTTEASAIVFPYMAPDNNSKFASNVALLHNIKYNSQNFSKKSSSDYNLVSNDYFNSGSKSMGIDVKQVSAEYVKLIGTEPEVIEKPSIDSLPKSLWEKFASFFN